MKICFPVQQDNGIESTVFNHFGSAPMFVVVDLEKNTVNTILNADQHHAHGACNPIQALDNQKIDVVVVGGIGAGALNRLSRNGIKVYRAQGATVKENVTLFSLKKLSEYSSQGCCSGHSQGSACAH